MIVGVILVALGVAPKWFTASFAAIVTAAIPVALVRGLLRLMVERGITVEVVAGAIAVYLTLGLIFAWVIAFVAQLGGQHAVFRSAHERVPRRQGVFQLHGADNDWLRRLHPGDLSVTASR
jgi:hypothetical protein